MNPHIRQSRIVEFFRLFSPRPGRKYITFSLALLLLVLFVPKTALADSLSGTMVVSVIDHDDRPSEYMYQVRKKSGKKVQLQIADTALFSPLALKTGAKVKLKGRTSGKQFVPTSVSLTASSPAVSSGGEIGGLVTGGVRRLAIIITNVGTTAAGCNTAQIESVMYSSTPSVRSLYEAASRGQLTFEDDTDGNGVVDIFGPVTVSSTAGSCADPDGWGQQAFEEARDLGFDEDDYQHVVMVLPRFCSYGGLGNIACGDQCVAYILNCTSKEAWAHELGHNFGLEHAATDTDNNGTIENEYGDQSCPMGFSIQGRLKYFNAPHQDQLGWLDAFPGLVTTVATSQTVNIAALENDAATSSYPEIIRIQKSGTDYYYLSYRTSSSSFGVDTPTAYVDKLNIHRYTEASGQKTRFISAIDTGGSFVDADLGLTICAVSKNGSFVNATLNFGGTGCTLLDDDGDDGDSSDPVAGDSDGDGVTDAQEIADGTNSSDPGSYRERLTSPVYTLWNSFLGMTNILELVNPDPIGTAGVTNVTVTLYSIGGEPVSEQSLSLSAGEQRDLIINSFPGFLAESYGVVRVEYTGNLSGRTSYYKSAASGGSYDFAFSVPLSPVLRGRTAGGFNTYQPSVDPVESTYVVYNWLTIVNLANAEKSFTINSYQQDGSLLSSRSISLSPLGRSDLDGGHGLLGPNVVGYHEVIPTDANGHYIAQLIRYGTDAPAGTAVTSYRFAFPLSAHAGNGSVQHLPLSRQFGETNWIEIVNTLNSSVDATVEFVDAAGNASVASQTFGPREQIHFLANDSRLASGSRGFVKITPTVSNSLVAQSMFYFLNGSGGVQAISGIGSREVLGASFSGSYNLFLGMENYLAVSNITGGTVVTTITSAGSDGGSGSKVITLGPRSTSMVAIKAETSLNASPDSYGSLLLQPDTANALSIDLFRLRTDSSIDFAFPTEFRAQ